MFLLDGLCDLLDGLCGLLGSFCSALAVHCLFQKVDNIFHGLWQKEANILLLGPDNARKTTLLRFLKNERLVQHQLTQYLVITEEFRIGRIKFKAFDWGGTETSLTVRRDYGVRVDAVVYLLEIFDYRRRFDELHSELAMLIFDVAMAKVPFLVLVDGPDFFLDDDLRDLQKKLGYLIWAVRNEGRRRSNAVKVFGCNIDCRTGYRDGFKWLSLQL